MRRFVLLISFLLVCFLTAALHSQIALVQAPTACVSNLGETSLTCTFANPVAAGDMLIASAMPLLTPGASAFTATVSDSVNGGWVHGVQCYTAYDAQADFFYFPNTAAGSDTVTLTYSNAAELYLSVAEYSGSKFFDSVRCGSDLYRLYPSRRPLHGSDADHHGSDGHATVIDDCGKRRGDDDQFPV